MSRLSAYNARKTYDTFTGGHLRNGIVIPQWTPPRSAVTICLRCQVRLSSQQTKPNPASKKHLTPELAHTRSRDGELQPRPLSRPLGLPHPPRLDENTGRDTRTLSQRRRDFTDYGKHRERREKIMSALFEKNYFRDIGNLGKIWKGKSIIAPSTPFKKGVALWFPNLEGMTLEGRGIGWGKKWAQTTPVLRDQVSIVTMVHTTWAEEQVQSFLSERENPALGEMIKRLGKEAVQFVTVNVEENPLKALMVRLFWGRLRRKTARDERGKYFLNRRGLSDDLRDWLAMWNSKVGYIYLIDGDCKVRWAANGYAQEEEKASIVRCVRRLVEEARGVKRVSPLTPTVKREEPAHPVSQSAPVHERSAGESQVVVT